MHPNDEAPSDSPARKSGQPVDTGWPNTTTVTMKSTALFLLFAACLCNAAVQTWTSEDESEDLTHRHGYRLEGEVFNLLGNGRSCGHHIDDEDAGDAFKSPFTVSKAHYSINRTHGYYFQYGFQLAIFAGLIQTAIILNACIPLRFVYLRCVEKFHRWSRPRGLKHARLLGLTAFCVVASSLSLGVLGIPQVSSLETCFLYLI
jgi:hypothetical protein